MKTKIIDIKNEKYADLIDEVNIGLLHLINEMESQGVATGEVKLKLMVTVGKDHDGKDVQMLEGAAFYRAWGNGWSPVEHGGGSAKYIEEL